MTTKESMGDTSPRKRFIQSVVCGIIVGFICGFVGAGGGMMMLLLLTSVLGYELKTAVGTSVFIMTFTAHWRGKPLRHRRSAGSLVSGVPRAPPTLPVGSCVAAKFANKASPVVLNRATGAILALLGIVMLAVNYL